MSDIPVYEVVFSARSLRARPHKVVLEDDHIADKKKALRLQRIELDKECLADKENLLAKIDNLEKAHKLRDKIQKLEPGTANDRKAKLMMAEVERLRKEK